MTHDERELQQAWSWAMARAAGYLAAVLLLVGMVVGVALTT